MAQEKLKIKNRDSYEKLVRVAQACKRAINLYENPRKDVFADERQACNHAVIKNFELFYPMLLGYLKYYLAHEYGHYDLADKTVFRVCFGHDLINKQELEILLESVDKYSENLLIYDEETASQLCEEIMSDFIVMEKLIERLKKNMGIC